LKSVSILIIVD